MLTYMLAFRYQYVMTVIDVLERMEQQARRDIENLIKAQHQALENPIDFLRKLVKGESLNLPRLQNVPDVLDLNWNLLLNSEYRSIPDASNVIKPGAAHKKSTPTHYGFYNVALDFRDSLPMADISSIQVKRINMSNAIEDLVWLLSLSETHIIVIEGPAGRTSVKASESRSLTWNPFTYSF